MDFDDIIKLDDDDFAYEIAWMLFQKGLEEGVDSLNDMQKVAFYIEDFKTEYNNGGLSGYFYNKLPELDIIQKTISSLTICGAIKVADLLENATSLFMHYKDPTEETTWNAVLEIYDPSDKLSSIDKEIDKALYHEYTKIDDFYISNKIKLLGNKSEQKH